jgi:dihydroorotate dehydrogenase (fumarate)
VAETRKAVKMPLFASLNAVSQSFWVEYARQLESAGVNGLELNFYSPPVYKKISAQSIEEQELDILAAVVAAVKIPVAVKLHPYYTNLLNHADQLVCAGAKALVVFNRLFEPDIDVINEAKNAKFELSSPDFNRVPLRWTALLSEQIKAEIISNTGIMSGKDVVKMILAGAQAVQVVSCIYAHGPSHLGKMCEYLLGWMKSHGYENLAQFRGKLARPQESDTWHFERGQYIKAVLGFD